MVQYIDGTMGTIYTTEDLNDSTNVEVSSTPIKSRAIRVREVKYATLRVFIQTYPVII